MRIELITTGSELLLGFTANAHAAYIARKLGDHRRGVALAPLFACTPLDVHTNPTSVVGFAVDFPRNPS